MCKKIKNDNLSAWKRKRKRRGFFGEERFKASSEIATSILITILLEKELLNSWFKRRKKTNQSDAQIPLIRFHLFCCRTPILLLYYLVGKLFHPETGLLSSPNYPIIPPPVTTTRFSLKIGDLSARRIYNYTSSLSLKDRKHGKRTKGRKEEKISKGK